MDKLLIASVKRKIDNIKEKQGQETQDFYDLAIREVNDLVVRELNDALRTIYSKYDENIDIFDLNNQDKEKLIDYVKHEMKKVLFFETFILLTFHNKGIVKMFAGELKKHDNVDREVVEQIMEDMTQKLYLEATKKKNKDLCYEKVYVIENIKNELKDKKRLGMGKNGEKISYNQNSYNTMNEFIKVYAYDLIKREIDTTLRNHFKEDDFLNDVFKDERLEKYYFLNCLKNELENKELNTDTILKALGNIADDVLKEVKI